MSDINKVIENPDTVKKNIEYEQQMMKLRKDVLEKFEGYRTTLNYMAADAPLEILCLPPAIHKALLNHGCLRVYDVFDLDFTKVKGLGVTRIRDLTACLDQFFSML